MPTERDISKTLVAVELVCLTVIEDRLMVLLSRREEDPHRGRLALPGDFLRSDEDLEAAPQRVLAEQTWSTTSPHVEQLATYGARRRDPRGRVVSVAWLVIIPTARDFATDTGGRRSGSWFPVQEVLDHPRRLAFDHAAIVHDAEARVRGKLTYSPLAADFCGEVFTITDLRRVYEVVWGVDLDPGNFTRKVTRAAGFIEPTGETISQGSGRPARAYRKGDAVRIHPALDLDDTAPAKRR